MAPWIPATIFTAVNSLIGLAIAYAYLKYKVDDLIKNETVSKGAQEKANAKLEETIKDTIKEFHDSIKEDRRTLVEIAALVKVSGAEQAIINKFTTGLLNSLSDKVEKLQKDYNEIAQCIQIIKAIIDKDRERVRNNEPESSKR